MRIVNDRNLPEPLYRALCNDKYDPGLSDFTPSSLAQPAYQARLMRDFGPSLSVAASTRVWAMFGTAAHSLAELAGEGLDHWECERRFYGTVQTPWGKKVIGAQVDILDLDKGDIHDIKTTRAWSYGKDKPDWASQLNVGRWCVWKETGVAPKRLYINAIYRDWSWGESMRSSSYPPSEINVIEIPVWTLSETEKWIHRRVDAIEAALAAPSFSEVEPCSPEETWAKPDSYAVMKRGARKAWRVKDTLEEAEEIAGEGHVIEIRRGDRPRCEKGYCPVSAFCPAYREFRDGKNRIMEMEEAV